MTTEQLFHGGRIRTMDAVHPEAEAVFVRDQWVVAVGGRSDLEGLCSPSTRRVDLGGGLLLPGFHDAHVHIWKVGQLLTTLLDVRGSASMADLMDRLRGFAGTLPGSRWFEGRGYNEALLAEGRHPTRVDLDRALGERPGLLTRTCAHIAVANSAALRRAGIDRTTPDPPGGVIEKDATGEPTGILHETAVGLVKRAIPAPTREDYEGWILAGCRHLRALGITSATDPAVHPELMEAYVALNACGALPIRVNTLAIRRPDGGTDTFPLPRRVDTPFLRCEGVKFFADGGLSGATAALRVPYRHAPTCGVLRFDPEELFRLASEAHAAGLRLGTHAIGDAALDLVLGIYDRIEREWGPGQRHRVEHFGLPDKEHLRLMADRGWIAVPQAIFLRELGANFLRYLPDAYIPRTYPLRDVVDAGITVALSSDGPVVRDCSPLSGIASAMLRADATGRRIAPEQALSCHEALEAYTRGGAIAAGVEDVGQLVRGARADLVLLGRDIIDHSPSEIPDIPVLGVWVDGKPLNS